jgi:hypothetical protein
MKNSADNKRLDKIELQLTPKQWAIRLADESRRYPSLEAFMQGTAKGTYRQSPSIAPFYALAEQAEERWPKETRKEFELSNKLRMEFQSLKSLINNINNDFLIRAERNRLRAALQKSKLHTLILQGAFVLIDAPEMLAESSASLARLRHSSLLDDWANDSTTLFKEIISYKAAVQIIQENYFESHPILYKDFETAFETTIEGLRDAIAEFNKYRKDNAEWTKRKSDRDQQKAGMANVLPLEPENGLPIDIEAIEKSDEMLVQPIVEKWVMNAKVSGIADILRETGKHEDFVWHHFQKKMELKS